MRRGLRFTPKRQLQRRSGMAQTDLRRKLRAFDSGGLFFRMLTRY
jgi:hypothetical protein